MPENPYIGMFRAPMVAKVCREAKAVQTLNASGGLGKSIASARCGESMALQGQGGTLGLLEKEVRVGPEESIRSRVRKGSWRYIRSQGPSKA